MDSLVLSLQKKAAILAGCLWSFWLFSEVVNGVALKPIVLIPGLAGTGLFARLDNVLIPECSPFPMTKSYFRIWTSARTLLPSRQKCWQEVISTTYLPPPHSTYINKPGVHITPDGYEYSSVEGFDYLDYIYENKSEIYDDDDHQQDFFYNTSLTRRLDERPELTRRIGMPGTEYFHQSIKAFMSAGYRDMINMAGLQFDWRLPFWQLIGPVKNGTCLGPWAVDAKKLIEKMYKNNGNEKVALIAHSLGTIMITVFLNLCVSRDWKNTYVDSYVSVCGVYGGSFKTVRAILSGYNDPFVFDFWNVVNVSLVPPLLLRKAQRTFGSAYSLAPTAQVYGEDYIVARLPLTNSSDPTEGRLSKLWSAAESAVGSCYYELVKMVNKFINPKISGQPACKADERCLTVGNWTNILPPKYTTMLNQAKQELGNYAVSDPGVPVYCLWSQFDNPTTDSSFVYKTTSIDEEPNIIYGYGDKTVPVESAKYCSNWNSTVVSHEFKNMEHTKILCNTEFNEFLVALVIGQVPSPNHEVLTIE